MSPKTHDLLIRLATWRVAEMRTARDLARAQLGAQSTTAVTYARQYDEALEALCDLRDEQVAA